MQLAEKQELIIAIGSFIADAVERATRPLLERIVLLEAKANKPIDLPKLMDADHVKTICDQIIMSYPFAEASSVEDYRSLIKELVIEEISSIPKPKDGEDGKDFDIEECRVLIKNLVDEAVSLIPKPKDGEDGEDGVTLEDCKNYICNTINDAIANLPKPKDGEPGKDINMEEVLTIIKTLVENAVDKIPKPKDGEDGKSISEEEIQKLVTNAIDAIPKPKDGEPGKDGINLADAMIDQDGNLVLIKSNGEAKQLGRIKGQDGEPGKDGIGFDDLSFEYDGERGLKLIWTKGDVIKECDVILHGIIDRGVFKEGTSYTRGDAVSWGGSLWIAQSDTIIKPGDGEKSWRLAVKKGRDGKVGEKGKQGDPGKPGKDGKLI